MTGAPTVEVLEASSAETRQRCVAGALGARGCRAGDRVVFCLPSSADLICAVLGAARIGVIPVLLNATLTASERDRLVADAQPSLLVVDASELSRLQEGPPAEVEAVLAAVPGITQLAVFGVPDEQWGQRVCVAYVAEDRGAEEAMRAAAFANLAPYKRPKEYFAITELPHTATGKLMRRAIPEYLGLTWGDGVTLR